MSDCNFDSGTRKRRHLDDDEEESDVCAPKILVEEPPFGLYSFCDEILLEIFKYVDSNTLYSLGSTCSRFMNLVSDHNLWKNVDLTSEGLPHKVLKKRLKCIHSQTQSIAIKGLTGTFPSSYWNNVTLGNYLLTKIVETCENLQVLELHECFLNLEKMNITDFPKTIKKLMFKNCYVCWPRAPHSFFTHIDVHLEKLEELYIEYCNWFETHDLVVFSKIPLLRKLSLQGCLDLNEFVPYGSIASRFGFKKLEYLDVRDTLISDSDIQCFSTIYTLKELLLECPENVRKATNGMHGTLIQRRQSSRYPGYGLSSNGVVANNRENNSVEIIIHDRSIINIRAPMHVNRADVEVFIVNPSAMPVNNPPGMAEENQNQQNVVENQQNAAENQQDQQQIPNINRAIARSLWFERRYPPTFSPPSYDPISDRGILSFGASGNARGRIVWICAHPRRTHNSLEKLTVRYYKRVTNISLLHLAECSPKLIYLDLTGTSVTGSGVEDFKLKKPNCTVIFDNLSD